MTNGEGKLWKIKPLEWKRGNISDQFVAETILGRDLIVYLDDDTWDSCVAGGHPMIAVGKGSKAEASLAAWDWYRSRLASALVEATPAQIRAALEGKDEG